jgi:hypothetical protein
MISNRYREYDCYAQEWVDVLLIRQDALIALKEGGSSHTEDGSAV